MGYAIYCRISRDRRGESAGVQRQETECRTYADQHGLTVDRVYTDNDISAYSGKTRPNYRAMLTAIANGTHDGIIVWHYDRLVRRLVDLTELLDVVKDANAAVYTVKAGDLDLSTPTGRMTASVVASISSYEVEHAQERILSSQADRAKQGLWRSGPPPFGYRRTDKPGHIEPDPAEKIAVRDMVSKILSGKSAASVARELNGNGITTRQGNPWRAGTIRSYLTSGAVAGKSVHRGKIIGEAQWDGLVTEDEWHTLTAILTDPKRLTRQGTDRRWSGSGVYKCGKCGSGMACQRSRNKCGWSYTCKDCGGITVDQQKADETVSQVIVGYLNKPENRLRLTGPSNEDNNAPELLAELNHLQERKKALGRMFADGQIDEDQMIDATTSLRARIDAVGGKIQTIRRSSPVSDLVLADDDLAARWEALTADAKADIIRELMDVTIMPTRPGTRFSPDRIRIDWK